MHSPLKRLFFLLATLLLWGCPTAETTQFELCELEIVFDSNTATANETISATGGPFTDVYDTIVEVGGHDAEVLTVEQLDCDSCDLCLVAAECNGCEPCDSCVEMCESCVHQLKFVLPDLEPAVTSVNVINRYGYGEATLTIISSEEHDDGT